MPSGFAQGQHFSSASASARGIYIDLQVFEPVGATSSSRRPRHAECRCRRHTGALPTSGHTGHGKKVRMLGWGTPLVAVVEVPRFRRRRS